jgi:NAD(P)-dependent dehydrogenase (short-subunit alcohol dehydrogenase family)
MLRCRKCIASITCRRQTPPSATPGTTEFTDEATFDRTMQNQALKKRNRTEHLADLVAFLAGADAEMITGQTILVDGGGFMH